MDRSDLATRMKDYEAISKTRLMKRCPVICRIDGKAFHTFTRGFKRPFDEILIKTMQETTKYLCENIQGCVLGYTQSDEITLVLVDYKELNTAPYFDYEVQKLCSIIASMTTMTFNRLFTENVEASFREEFTKRGLNGSNEVDGFNKLQDEYKVYTNKLNQAMFDCRVFNIPKEEVTNNIYWRQLDASRNSVQMVGQANFSHNKLQKKSCNKIQDMLMTQRGINWNDFPTYQKRGTCIIKESYIDAGSSDDSENVRTHWIIDKNIPIFKGEGREYIEKLINF